MKFKMMPLLLSAMVMVGCASTRQFVPFPDQSKTIENPEMARIYVMRPASYGGIVSMRVNDGDVIVGNTGPRGFLSWERTPGTATLSSKAENKHSMDLKVEKGMTYYILQHVKMGFLFAGTKLEELNNTKGLSILKKCNPPKLESK